MSASSISRAAQDPELLARVNAVAHQEAQNNPELSETQFAARLRQGMTDASPLMWAVAVDTEAPYETALQSGRGAPGHDVDIITDAQITASVQANWPPDPEV
jgi:hypothetical protein